MSSGDAMDPSGPSQPSINTSYENPSNPALIESERQSFNSTNAAKQRSDPAHETRQPNDIVGAGGNAQAEAMPSSLGYGALDSSGDAGESMGGAVSNTEGEQMRAAGDGDIAVAQDKKHGFGEQSSLTSGLDRKKEEQSQIKDQRHGESSGGGVDVSAAVGGKGFVGASNDGTHPAGGAMQNDHTHV